MKNRVRISDGTLWPDPVGSGDALWHAYHGNPTKEQARRVAELASAYAELLCHPWGTEVSLKKLRMLRQALKKEEQ